MSFLNPFFLVGLFAVAIPVIIHLINLHRPEKLSFPTLAFFNVLKNTTIRRIRIKRLMLLALRTLAVLLLVLALARPFLPPVLNGSSGTGDDPKAIVILMDNSPSMSRIGPQGPLIEQGKHIANAIVDGAWGGDRFIVATTNGGVEVSLLTGSARARELISEVETSNTGNFLDEVIQMLFQQLNQVPMKQAVVYVISDGQRSQFVKLGESKSNRSRLNIPVSMQMVQVRGGEQQNLAITLLTLESQMLSKDAPLSLRVAVKNVGEAAVSNNFVSLETGDRITGQYPVALDPGESQEFVFEVVPSETGNISGRVMLEGDEVTYDNSRYFAIRIPESRSVLLIAEEETDDTEYISYIRPALRASELANTQIRVEEARPDATEPSSWPNYDVLILDGLRTVPEYWFQDLQRYVQNGRGLLFFPSEQGSIQNYNAFLDLFKAGIYSGINGEYASFRPVEQMSRLVEGHPILNNLFEKKVNEQIQVDLPELFFYYRYRSPENAGSYPVLRTETGMPLLAEQRFGDGKVLVSAMGTDPGWSNFPVNALFAPIYYRTVLYAASSEQGGIEEHVLGEPFVWEGGLISRTVELVKGEQSARPEVQGLPAGIRIRYQGYEWEPGILQIDAGEEKRIVAVNQHIMESDYSTLKEKELENMLGNSLTVHSVIDAHSLTDEGLKQRLDAAGFGEELWNWFVWAALLVLVAETLIARLYKTESIS